MRRVPVSRPPASLIKRGHIDLIRPGRTALGEKYGYCDKDDDGRDRTTSQTDG